VVEEAVGWWLSVRGVKARGGAVGGACRVGTGAVLGCVVSDNVEQIFSASRLFVAVASPLQRCNEEIRGGVMN
jgi:hypothetical protein